MQVVSRKRPGDHAGVNYFMPASLAGGAGSVIARPSFNPNHTFSVIYAAFSKYRVPDLPGRKKPGSAISHPGVSMCTLNLTIRSTCVPALSPVKYETAMKHIFSYCCTLISD